jgi:adenylate cyclase
LKIFEISPGGFNSEALTATELKTLLNDFFTPVTGIIFDNSGTIDKYVGELVMVFWGAPLVDTNHRLHAVTAALQILQNVDELRLEFVRRVLPEVRIGVGVNTGIMNVGDMRSVYRRSYTVLGDAVNLSSRLEGLTKYYGVSCLIGENTRDALKGIVCRLIDKVKVKVKVKSKDQPVRIYEPICSELSASVDLLVRVEAWNELLEMYFMRQWDAVEDGFKAIQEQDAEAVLCEIYLKRIDKLGND